MLAAGDGAAQGRAADAAVDLLGDPRGRIGLQGRGAHLTHADGLVAEAQLGHLVAPAVYVLLEAGRMRGGGRRHVLDAPVPVEPDVDSVHAQVEEVVEVLAAGDLGVEGDARVGVGRHGEAAAAQDVGPADTRTAQGVAHPLVELGAFGPETVAPARLALPRVGGALAVEEVARLGEDGQALAVGVAEAVDRLDQEVLVLHHLVVVQKDDHVVAEGGRHGKSHVADGTVPPQGQGLLLQVGRDVLDGAADRVGLGVADDHHAQVGVLAADALHAGTGAGGAGARRDQKDDYAQDAADFLEGGKAGLELGHRFGDRGRMVVDADLAHRGQVLGIRPIGGYDDDRVHGASCDLLANVRLPCHSNTVPSAAARA